MRKNHSAEYKARLVLEVFKQDETLSEIASKNGIHPTLLTRWKADAIRNMPCLFEPESRKARKQRKEYETQIEELYKQIGKLTAQLEWLKKKSER